MKAVEGSQGYHEWRALKADEEPLRYRALKAFNSFQSGLVGILGRHDPMRLHTLQYGTGEAHKLIEQRAHIQIAAISDVKNLVFRCIVESLDTLPRLDDPLDEAVVVMPDTSALIDFPSLDDYHVGFPSVRLLLGPTVLGELDDLKRRRDKRDEVRNNAQEVIRRMATLGDQGDLLQGVAITDRIILMTLAPEPRADGLPSWLDLSVPDDRFIASALEMFWEHSKARILTVSGDFNVVNKARAAGLAAVYGPSAFEDNGA